MENLFLFKGMNKILKPLLMELSGSASYFFNDEYILQPF